MSVSTSTEVPEPRKPFLTTLVRHHFEDERWHRTFKVQGYEAVIYVPCRAGFRPETVLIDQVRCTSIYIQKMKELPHRRAECEVTFHSGTHKIIRLRCSYQMLTSATRDDHLPDEPKTFATVKRGRVTIHNVPFIVRHVTQ